MILKNRKCYQTEPGNRLDEGDASQRWSGITVKAAIQMHIVADDWFEAAAVCEGSVVPAGGQPVQS